LLKKYLLNFHTQAEKNWGKREILFHFLDLISDKFLNKIIKLVDYILVRIWIIFCIFVNEGGKEEENYHLAEEVKMVIKCSFLVSLESIGDYAKHFADSPLLAKSIIKKGPT
jgi:hypothetical protein